MRLIDFDELLIEQARKYFDLFDFALNLMREKLNDFMREQEYIAEFDIVVMYEESTMPMLKVHFRLHGSEGWNTRSIHVVTHWD